MQLVAWREEPDLSTEGGQLNHAQGHYPIQLLSPLPPYLLYHSHTHTSSLTVQKGFTSCSIHAPAAPVPLPSDCQRDTLDCPHGRRSCQCLH